MPVLLPIKVILTCEGKEQQGVIHARYWTKRQAKRRGFKFFCLIYTIGLAASLNPVLIIHLLIPPFWVIVGPLAGYHIARIFTDTIQLRRGEGTCPACAQSTALYPYGEVEAFTARCRSCEQELKGRAIDPVQAREYITQAARDL
jgi:hypothetical protein